MVEQSRSRSNSSRESARAVVTPAAVIPEKPCSEACRRSKPEEEGDSLEAGGHVVDASTAKGPIRLASIGRIRRMNDGFAERLLAFLKPSIVSAADCGGWSGGTSEGPAATERCVAACRACRGLCVCCYVASTGQPVALGDEIGALAARAIADALMKTQEAARERLVALFEARLPARPAVLAQFDGVVSLSARGRLSVVTVTPLVGGERRPDLSKWYEVFPDSKVLVAEGDAVTASQPLSTGPIDPVELLGIIGFQAFVTWFAEECGRIFARDGVEVDQVHLEVMARWMSDWVRVVDPGETGLVEGATMTPNEYEAANDRALAADLRLAMPGPVLVGLPQVEQRVHLDATMVELPAPLEGRVGHVGGIESVLLDGRRVYFGFDYRADLVLSPPIESLDVMAAYAARYMEQSHRVQDSAYWLKLAERATYDSHLASVEDCDLKLSLIRSQLDLARQAGTHPQVVFPNHLLFLLAACCGSDAPQQATALSPDDAVAILSGGRPLPKACSMLDVVNAIDGFVLGSLDAAPRTWSEALSALRSRKTH